MDLSVPFILKPWVPLPKNTIYNFFMNSAYGLFVNEIWPKSPFDDSNSIRKKVPRFYLAQKKSEKIDKNVEASNEL